MTMSRTRNKVLELAAEYCKGRTIVIFTSNPAVWNSDYLGQSRDMPSEHVGNICSGVEISKFPDNFLGLDKKSVITFLIKSILLLMMTI